MSMYLIACLVSALFLSPSCFYVPALTPLLVCMYFVRSQLFFDMRSKTSNEEGKKEADRGRMKDSKVWALGFWFLFVVVVPMPLILCYPFLCLVLGVAYVIGVSEIERTYS